MATEHLSRWWTSDDDGDDTDKLDRRDFPPPPRDEGAAIREVYRTESPTLQWEDDYVEGRWRGNELLLELRFNERILY